MITPSACALWVLMRKSSMQGCMIGRGVACGAPLLFCARRRRGAEKCMKGSLPWMLIGSALLFLRAETQRHGDSCDCSSLLLCVRRHGDSRDCSSLLLRAETRRRRDTERDIIFTVTACRRLHVGVDCVKPGVQSLASERAPVFFARRRRGAEI